MAALPSCGDDNSDDTLTENLVSSYMDAVCDFNIPGMNKCRMTRIDASADSSQATASCVRLASLITWECEGISINGSSAVASIKMTVPVSYEKICFAALGDAMDSLGKNPDQKPSDALDSAIRSRGSRSDRILVTKDIRLSKVGDKWYVASSPDIDDIIFDIRSQVSAVYSVISR